MGKSHDENRPVDHGHARQAEALRGPCEAAPQEAPAGGPPCQIDTHLAQPPEADRPARPGDFQRIEGDSPQHRGESGDLATEVVAPDRSSDHEATTPDHPGPPAASAAAQPSSPSERAETIEYGSAVATAM